MSQHEDSNDPTENNEQLGETSQEEELPAIPLGPATQAIIIQSIN